jgi:cytochrome c peroxidase
VGRHREVQGANSARARGPAPYFHNGSAATLDDVIDFYESRFNLERTAQERSDLLAFLRVL